MAEFQTPRGMRDFLPSQMIFREQVMGVIKAVFEKYGYDPLETPALERLDVLNAKAGEEVDKQVYKVEGGELGLRFDLTVPLARVVSSNKNLPLPFKRYCISRVWRRDEPQKGRFREFWQADVDVVGSASMECEAELLACACECLNALGFDSYAIILNNRKILDAIIERVGIGKGEASAVFRSLDKLEKIGVEEVNKELREKKIEENKISGLLKAIESKEGMNEERLKKMSEFVGECDGLKELRDLLSACVRYGVSGRVKVDFGLVRGLGYYTGPVFEIKAGAGIGSVSGGGRYDNLIESYGAQKTPAVGISLGIERLLFLLDEKERKQKKTKTQVFVAAVKPELKQKAVEIAGEFRKAGIRVQVDLMGRNLRKQFEYANALGVRFMAVVGEKELSEGKIVLKNLESGVEEKKTVEEAINEMRKD